ncbi:15607_t:CDS:1, partial [Dentiscutata erythropus]
DEMDHKTPPIMVTSLSFASLLFLFLVNLNTPTIIRSICILSASDDNTSYPYASYNTIVLILSD